MYKFDIYLGGLCWNRPESSRGLSAMISVSDMCDWLKTEKSNISTT